MFVIGCSVLDMFLVFVAVCYYSICFVVFPFDFVWLLYVFAAFWNHFCSLFVFLWLLVVLVVRYNCFVVCAVNVLIFGVLCIVFCLFMRLKLL